MGLRLVAGLVLGLALRGDPPAPAATPARLRVLLLGAESPEARRAYAHFLRAVERTQPEMARRTQFDMWNMEPFDQTPDAGVDAAMQQRPDLVVALNGYYAAAARRRIGNTPLVFASYEDPVRYGIVSRMGPRPEAVCGISLADTLDGKRLEILQQAFPRVHTVAVLADASWAEELGGRERVEQQARRLGLQAKVLLAEDATQAKALLQDAASARFDAWYLPATQVADEARTTLIERMRSWQAPNIWATTEQAHHGGQIAYAQDTDFVWSSAAELVARVLAGEHPGTMPVLRPLRFALTVRVDAGNGMPDPHISIVRRADSVIR